LNFLDRFKKKNTETKFYENPSGGGIWVVHTDGQQGRHREASSRFSQFCKRA